MDRLTGISQSHVFKFVLNDDSAVMFYKNWPVAHEEYREVDVTDKNVRRRSVPILPNPRIHPLVEKLNADLEK